ncbi:MAG: PIN domain-containing protein [Chthoniobacteraceae bacterium]
MNGALDTSVLVAALVPTAEFHAESLALLNRGGWSVCLHGLAETFNTLTGGRLGFRVPADAASEIIRLQILPSITSTLLAEGDMLGAFAEASPRGIRGAILYDYLHLVAAKKAQAEKIYTLNVSDFRHFHRPGDPEIAHPAM